MKIVIISPTYNEKINITKLIPLLEKDVFPLIKNHDIRLLIVDDNSPDGTGDVVKEFMKKWDNISLLQGNKNGLGAAYIRGMKYAMEEMHADAIVEFDADFQHDPNDIPRLITAMDEGADYVIGSRYIPGGAIPKEWGIDRKIQSILGSLFARIVWLRFDIHDMTSGYKLTKTSFLKKIDLDNLYSKYYAYKMHILHDMIRSSAKVKEVPIIFYERTEGTSKIARKDIIDSFIVVLRLRYDDSKRFIKFLIVGGTGFLFQILTEEISIFSGLTVAFATFLDSIYYISDITALSHATGAGIGAEAAIISNFLINNFWTFSDTRGNAHQTPAFLRFIKFNLASVLSIIIQFTAVWIGEKSLGPMTSLGLFSLPTRILIVIPTIILIVIPLNYIIYNKVIWKTQYLKDGNTKKT